MTTGLIKGGLILLNTRDHTRPNLLGPTISALTPPSLPNYPEVLTLPSVQRRPTHSSPSDTMAPSDELEYLKGLVAQLNEKIHALEDRAKHAVQPKTPAQQLRAILVGPPGSGTCHPSLYITRASKR